MTDFDNLLWAIGGVQLTLIGLAVGLLHDFQGISWPLAIIGVLAGTYIVARQLWIVHRTSTQ